MAEPARLAEGQLLHPPTIPKAASSESYTGDKGPGRRSGRDGEGLRPVSRRGCIGTIPTPSSRRPRTDMY
eukprot:6187784-Pleurochrysis_carterae.AAC.3